MRICEWQPGATVACEIDREAHHITFRYIDGWAFLLRVVSASAFADKMEIHPLLSGYPSSDI
jgi:hypothetical protein